MYKLSLTKLIQCVSILLAMLNPFLWGTAHAAAETNLALGAPYWVSQAADPTYPDVSGRALTNGEKGLPNYTDPAWQGHLRDEFRVVTVDLGGVKHVQRVDASFLHDAGAGIFAPDQVMVQTSTNGQYWSEPLAIAKAQLGHLASPSRQVFSFANVNHTARYVRVVFFVDIWVFVDQIEVWGDDTPASADASSHTLDMNDPYLRMRPFSERAPWDMTTQPPPTDAYFPAGSPQAGGVRHMALIYTSGSRWEVANALPYVAYGKRPNSSSPVVQWVDWFFDSFLFLSLYTPNGRQYGSVAHGGSPALWEDWLAFIDDLFQPDEQLHAFDQAVERAKHFMDDTGYRAKVIVMIPYPMTSITEFGDPQKKGRSLSFTSYGQGARAQTEARLTAVQAYIDELEHRWVESEYRHLELVGLYWLAEEINGAADLELIQQVSRASNARGYRLFWIPYWEASGWAQWRQAGFDAVMLQPNYMFSPSVPAGRLQQAADNAHRFGMGMEIEADTTVLTSNEGRAKYLAYLRAGAEHAFMQDALHGYYQEIDVLLQAFLSRQADVRHVYDATYEYIKGVYKP